MSKQTSVEWLFSQLPDHLRLSRDGFDLLNQAKEMEREQIISFGYTQIQYIDSEIGDLIYKKVPEEIYNETYGGSDEQQV
jgi:hypothetical protein